MMLVTILLLAVLTIGAASASDDVLSAGNSDELSQDLDIEAVEDFQDESLADGDAEDVLSYEASDFNVYINESVDLADEDAAAVTFEAPDGAQGKIWLRTDQDESIFAYGLDESPLKLYNLNIDSVGTYLVNVSFKPSSGSELPLASGTINVVKLLGTRDFYGKVTCAVRATNTGAEIVELEDSPAAGNLLVYVDGNLTYNHAVLKGSNLIVYDNEIGIYGKRGNYSIQVRFNTTEGKVVKVNDFNLDYDLLPYQPEDFNVYINESMDLADKDAAAVTFEVPDGAEGEILIEGDHISYIRSFDINDSPLTLYDLDIYSAGIYSINVSFESDDGRELLLASGTINVTLTLTESSFDVYHEDDDTIIGSLTLDIFRLYDCPADGRLAVFVDGNLAYNESISAGDYAEFSSKDLGIDGKNDSYSIVAKFYTDDGQEFTIADFKAYYIYVEDSDDDSDAGFYEFDRFDPLTNPFRTVFYLKDSPADGTLILFADNKEVYNVSVSKGGNVYISGNDFGITEYGLYKLAANFTGDDGKQYYTGSADVYYNAHAFILIEDLVDVSYYRSLIAYVRDDSGINGTVTLSINGREYYNKKLDGTFLTEYIFDTDLEGINISGDFIGNYTVKVTYGNMTKESTVSFEYVPFIFFPNYMPVGDESYVVLKAASGSTGTVSLYDSVKVGSGYDVGSLIGTYQVTGNRTNIPLPGLTEGVHVFFANYTVNGKNYMEGFGVYAFKNSENLTSELSSDKINVGDSVTVTVTGPKKGGIDIYADGDYCKYIPLENGTVEYVLSNLGLGTHVIAISYDDDGDFEEFYSKFIKVSVLKDGETIDDNNTGDNQTAGNKTDDNPAGNQTVDNKTDVVDISNTAVVLSANSFTFNNKVQKPTVKTIDGKALVEGTDYTVAWSNPSSKNAGTYTVTVTGKGSYSGTTSAKYTINKAANPLAVKAKTAKVKYSTLKKKAQTLAVTKVVTFSKKGQGTMTYAKASGNKKITINKKTGKVTVKKGLKKGTYKVKVKIKANGNTNYKASAYKTVTFKIIVK